jgi:imidazolonepropionase-like amidohydrolase
MPRFIPLVLLAALPLHSDLLIRNVDIKTGSILEHRSILIHGDRIRSINAAGPARGAQIVDGGNRYVIPGLWDMHVHLWHKDNQFPMFLAWGVTGVRDMGSDLAQVNRWRAAIKKRELLGPHIEICGPSVDGSPSDDPKLPVLLLHSPNDALTTYDRLEQDLKVDFISVGRNLPRDAYFALIERARKWGLPVAGFVPDGVSIDEAVAARQSSIEQLSGVASASSDELFDRMAKFESYQVPTMIKLRRMTYAHADEVIRDPLLKYIPAAIRKNWEDPRLQEAKLSLNALDSLDREYVQSSHIVDRMQRFKVPIMAGTDTGEPYTFPGYDLHRELQLLVKAGLSPLQALRAATITPAEFLEAGDSLGTVAPGKMADLVLLDADPLTDIRNTQKIAAVVLGGRYLPKAKLDAMLPHARQ